jgi:hypothetical protein
MPSAATLRTPPLPSTSANGAGWASDFVGCRGKEVDMVTKLEVNEAPHLQTPAKRCLRIARGMDVQSAHIRAPRLQGREPSLD